MRNKRYRCQFKRIGVGMLFVGPLMAASWFMLPVLGQHTGGGMPVTQLGPDYDLSWHTIDGGGVMFSNGGDFELSGTIGQPDAGTLTSGEYTLTGGFWFALAPGDCNSDGGVTLFDYGDFESCFSGPGAGVAPGCACFDLDRDGSVDLEDFAAFARRFSGP
ncbi:MAG: hypothetical protein AAB363_01740 [Planctomycetota bacterium]